MIDNNTLILHYTFNGLAEDPGELFDEGGGTNTELKPRYDASEVVSVTYEPGAVGRYCAKFNGSSSYVKSRLQIPELRAINFTFSWWMKTTGGYSMVVWGTQNYQYGAWTEGTKIVVNQWDSTGNHKNICRLTSQTTLTPNVWYHVAWTFNGTDMILYINGEEDYRCTPDSSVADVNRNNNYIYLGGKTYSWGKQAYFSGCLDDFRVYGMALPAKDIKHLYEAAAMFNPDGSYTTSLYEQIDENRWYVTPQKVTKVKELSEEGLNTKFYRNKALFSSHEKNGATIIDLDNSGFVMTSSSFKEE